MLIKIVFPFTTKIKFPQNLNKYQLLNPWISFWSASKALKNLGGYGQVLTKVTPTYLLNGPLRYQYAQWIKIPDHLSKLILRSDCWKQVSCAYSLSANASFCFKKSSKATKGKKFNEGQQNQNCKFLCYYQYSM